MAAIGEVQLALTPAAGSVKAKVTYTLFPTAFDVNSGQPYIEICRLLGDDTGQAGEDGTDDFITDGVLRASRMTFPNSSPIVRTFEKVIEDDFFNEDQPGNDDIRAIVTMTPEVASKATRESNLVVGNFS